jgi:tripartite-type tricarboxylate transporter receptor subunit TctC
MKLVTATAALLMPLAFAQSFPNRPIRILVPYAPGGGADIYARLVAQTITGTLGQAVLVENEPGASGTIALNRVAKAPPDGHMLAMALSSAISVAPHLYRKLPYKAEDFAAVAPVGNFAFYAYLANEVPAKNWKEFVQYAKANPGKINMVTSGPGSTPQLVGEMIKQATGIESTFVPYKGAGLAWQDLITSRVHLYTDLAVPGLATYVRSGNARVLGVLSEERQPSAPDIPTLKEMGYPDLVASVRFSLVAPKGTPKEVIERINAAVRQARESGPLHDRIVADGSAPGISTAEQLETALKADYQKWGRVVRTLNIQLD